MYEKILIVVPPGAGTATSAVGRAASIAARGKAELELLAVMHDPHLEGYLGHAEVYAPLRERLLAERRSELEQLAAELRGRGLRCSAEVLWTHAASEAVARAAVQSEAALVVIQPQEQGRRLSHDDWRLVSICPGPVLVARGAETPYSKIIAAVDPGRSHHKPAGLDLAILNEAQAMRDVYDAQLEVLHCFTPLTEFASDSALDGVLIADVQQTLEADRRQDMKELVEQAGLPAEFAEVLTGRPADVLIDRGKGNGAELIVLGTVSRGPIRSFLLGSTAERVLRAEGGADVLVVKPPGFDSLSG
jgi:universal stress protein E